MADLNKIMDDLSALTVVEAAELVKALEEKWGVKAASGGGMDPAAMAAMAAAAGGGGGAVRAGGGRRGGGARAGGGGAGRGAQLLDPVRAL